MDLEADKLTCERGGRLLFSDLKFALSGGDGLVLRGANGSGKSSLLKIVATLLTPSDGELRWRGQAVAEEPDHYRRRIGYVGHLDAVKPALTVRENLTQWARLLVPGGGETSVEGALDTFAISHLADMPAQHLSAGQRKRTALARLLLRDNAIWLLDEPSVSLDRDGVDRLIAAIDEHRSGGGMVLVATHIDLGLTGAADLHLGGGALTA